MMTWPTTISELEAVQEALASQRPEPWSPPEDGILYGGCFVAFARGVQGAGGAGDPAWAAAVLVRNGETAGEAILDGSAGAPYEPGLLALREGALLEAAVRRLPRPPDVLLVNGTGRDHPRRCGLAHHLGAVLSVPTVGVTHRPLKATGDWPSDSAEAVAPLTLDGDRVGYWLRTRQGTRPLAVHAAWSTSPEVALEVVRRSIHRHRTPEPLRRAREVARLARQAANATT